MTLLDTLRRACALGRFAVLWFVMSLAAAIASPLVSPQSMELICSGSGVMKVLVKNADGSSSEATARMADCPLCASVSAPPPALASCAHPRQPLGDAAQPAPTAHIAVAVSAPPPARGPPARS